MKKSLKFLSLLMLMFVSMSAGAKEVTDKWTESETSTASGVSYNADLSKVVTGRPKTFSHFLLSSSEFFNNTEIGCITSIKIVLKSGETASLELYAESTEESLGTTTTQRGTFSDGTLEATFNKSDNIRWFYLSSDAETNKFTSVEITYEKDPQDLYTVQYLDATTLNTLQANKVVKDEDASVVNGYVTENAAVISGYVPEKESERLKISSDVAQNVITFFYDKATSYTVKYMMGETAVATAKTVDNVVVGTKVTEIAPTITGYAVDVPSKELTLNNDAEQNTIVFNYTRTIVNYTLTLKCNDVELGTKTGSGNVGTSISIPLTDITKDNNKYFKPSETYLVELANTDYTADVEYIAPATYTVVYKNTTLENKVVTEQLPAGTKVTEIAPTVANYSVDAPSKELTLVAGNENTITFTYTKTAVKYTVNFKYGENTIGETIVGYGNVNSTVTVALPEIEGYIKPAENKNITLGTEDVNVTVDYKKTTSYTVKYMMGETAVATAKTVNNVAVGDEVTETAIKVNDYYLADASETQTKTLVDGTNEITFNYSNKVTYTVKYLCGTTEIATSKVVEGADYMSTVTENAVAVDSYNLIGSDVQAVKLTENNMVIEFNYEEKQYVNIKFSTETEYKSYCPSQDIELPEDVWAYWCSSVDAEGNGKIVLQRISTRYIKAGEGVLLRNCGTAGKLYDKVEVVKSGASSIPGNQMKGITEPKEFAKNSIYVFGKKGDKFEYGLYKGGTRAANTSYIPVPEGITFNTAAPSLQIVFEDDNITDIEDAVTENKAESDNGAIYTISGAKVNEMTGKGIYIKNGKKILKRN